MWMAPFWTLLFIQINFGIVVAWIHKYKKYNNPTFFLKVDKPPKRISVPLAPPLCPFKPLTHGAYMKGEMPGSLLVQFRVSKNYTHFDK